MRALAHTPAKVDILAKEATLDHLTNMVLRPEDLQVLVPDLVAVALVTLSVDQADPAVPSEEQPLANTSPPTLALEALATATSTPNPAIVTK